jgi:hypothetical protein
MPDAPVINSPSNILHVDISQAAIHDDLFFAKPLKSPSASSETNSKKIDRATKVAKSELKKKNRKRHKKGIVVPYNAALESGTVYKISGSRSDLDGNWLVVDMNHSFVKGAGATSTINLERCITTF